jgi:hypothetical protein
MWCACWKLVELTECVSYENLWDYKLSLLKAKIYINFNLLIVHSNSAVRSLRSHLYSIEIMESYHLLKYQQELSYYYQNKATQVSEQCAGVIYYLSPSRDR